MKAVIAQAMVEANWATVLESYTHIKPFTVEEVQDFLDGKQVKGDYRDRSYQFKQVVSAIGANLIDRDKADADTYRVYKQLWTLEDSDKCEYCGRAYKFKMMMHNDGNCGKPRCMMAHMRDSI